MFCVVETYSGMIQDVYGPFKSYDHAYHAMRQKRQKVIKELPSTNHRFNWYVKRMTVV